MPKIRPLILVLGFSLFFTTVSFSEPIEFQEVMSFSIPTVSGIDEYCFDDIDYDGVPEILIRSSIRLILFSITGDTIIYETYLDAAYDYKTTLGDINRDSVSDIAVAHVYDISGMFVDTDSAYAIDLYNGATGYATTRQYYPNFYNYFYGKYWLGPGISTFTALDVNSDGYKELLVSYCHGVDDIYVPTPHIWNIYYPSNSRCYFSFPDSTLWSYNYYLKDPGMVQGDFGNFLSAYRWSHGSGRYVSTTSSTTSESILLFDPTSENYSVHSEGSGISCSFSASNTIRTDNFNIETIGDLDTDQDGYELLSTFHFAFSCSSPTQPPEQASGHELRMYSVNAFDSISLLWSTDYLGHSDYIYLPDHPGYFFAFDDSRFIQFDGSDGSEFQATENIPTGIRKWEYPYGDNQPYLVVTNGGQITVYKPGDVTSADGEDQLPLPGSFVVGKPYPNPFNATQTIPIKAVRGRHLTVDVYNLLGQKVDNIYDGPAPTASFDISWDADRFASGIYFIRAASNGQTQIVRSLLLK